MRRRVSIAECPVNVVVSNVHVAAHINGCCGE